MDEKIFDRIEKKYLIDAEQKKAIIAKVRENMKEDHYYKSEVFNVYFDTGNYDLIIKSIENPDFKEKLRARSYGGYDKVFLEIKTKLKSEEFRVGYKRRFLITHGDYNKLIRKEKSAVELAEQKVETANDIQIAREVDYLINHFNLEPKILVYYNRESYIGENKLRITFDEDLKFREEDLRFVQKPEDNYYFNTRKNITMEIKAHGVLPLWLVKSLSENQAYPTQFSKIGKIYALINNRKEKNV